MCCCCRHRSEDDIAALTLEVRLGFRWIARQMEILMTTIQEDVVAAIDAVDGKIDDVVIVLDEHTAALAEVRKQLEDALKAQDFSLVAAAKDRLVERTTSLAAAADRMRAGDPPAVVESVTVPAVEPAPAQV